jgi:hypothetical protein
MQQVLQQMDRYFSSPLAQVAQVVQPRAPAELTQAMVDLLLFQVVELQLAPLLVVAVVDMVTLQVPLVDQVAAVATAEQEDLQPPVKVTPEALAYPTTQVSG